MKLISLLFIFLFGFIACEDSGGGGAALDESFKTSPTASGRVQVGGCFEDQYAAVEQNISRKLDIIIVPDTSGSIVEERSDIASGFDQFINSLPEEVDYRIGVILGHSGKSSRAGVLYQKGVEPLVLDSELQTVEQIKIDLDTKMKNPAGDNYSDGGEMGLYSLQRAILENKATIQGQGLFREDAALAIIFVADEQDICFDYPEHITMVPDGQNKEIPAKIKYCQDAEGNTIITPASVLAHIKELAGDNPLVVGGVIYNNTATVPKVSENEVGYGYKELIELAAGVTVDLASGDYGPGLANLGKLAQVTIKPETEFALGADDIKPESLEVLINNKPASFTYDDELNIVSLTDERDPFDVVKINYCEKDKVIIQVSKIIAGGSHTCAIISDGTFKCWGSNSFGQLGQGNIDNIGDDELPMDVDAIDFGQKVTSASAGLNHTCVLLEDGTVKCFGDNSRGQLGQGHTDNLGDDEDVAVISAIDLGRPAIAIYSGTKYNCALLNNQNIKCWGENNFGQLGYGHTDNLGDDEDLNTYGEVNLGDQAVALDISTISYHTCAVLKTSGGLKCWGLNNQGQLGYGHKNNLGDDEEPDSFAGLIFGHKILQVATGYTHTCALSDAQQVRCWGANSQGQTGFGSVTTIGDDESADSADYLDFGNSGSLMVATGNYHTCTIGSDYSLHCFGLANQGQTGHGNTDKIGDDEAVTGNTKINSDLKFSQVATGLLHTCALTKDAGNVMCFGSNASGRLGYGHTDNIGDDEDPSGLVSVIPLL